MAKRAWKAERAFKTAWFSKAARKALITDEQLCIAMRQVRLGQADDLGGGVFKKRLSRNLYRSIILASGLAAFRALAVLYARKTEADIARELAIKEIVEICDDENPQIQE